MEAIVGGKAVENRDGLTQGPFGTFLRLPGPFLTTRGGGSLFIIVAREKY